MSLGYVEKISKDEKNANVKKRMKWKMTRARRRRGWTKNQYRGWSL